MTEQQTTGHFQEMEEAFRRIDACLRACRGIPTAELEAKVVGPLATEHDTDRAVRIARQFVDKDTGDKIERAIRDL